MKPNNQYCIGGRSRNASTAPTRTPRPTQPPDPTRTPRPTQTPEPPGAGRATGASEASAARSASSAADGGRTMPSSGGDGSAGDDALDELRGSAALAGTGAPLGAAPPRGGSAPSRPAGVVDNRPAPVVVAEYAGVRVIGPLQWAADGERPAVAGAVHNGGAQAWTMVLTLFLLDAQGARLGTAESVLWDLAPGEIRPFTQAVPPLPDPATDVSARLEPLVP